MAKVLGTVGLGVIAAILGAGPVLADNYTINSYSVPNGTSLVAQETSPSVGTSENAGKGIANITDTTLSTTSNVTVFSSSITSTTISGTYSLAVLSTAPTGGYLDTTKLTQLNALLSAVANGALNPNSATTGAALQAAIWEVLYSSGDSGYGVTSGNFQITGGGLSTVDTDANNYLTYITNGTWLANSNDSIYQYTSGSNESLIYLGVTATGKPVIPEPRSLALLATGLFGIAVLRRRRQSRAAT